MVVNGRIYLELINAGDDMAIHISKLMLKWIALYTFIPTTFYSIKTISK